LDLYVWEADGFLDKGGAHAGAGADFQHREDQEEVGYRPKFTTAEGTKRAVDWYIEHQEVETGGKKTQWNRRGVEMKKHGLE
jgi:hypothetical protein